jgi:hypothetical protein
LVAEAGGEEVAVAIGDVVASIVETVERGEGRGDGLVE